MLSAYLEKTHDRLRLYLDNAATSFPKPRAVAEAMADYMLNVGASAGRGAYREAMQSRHLLDDTRQLVRRVLGCASGDHVIFTLNGTDALNIGIKSLVRAGDHVLTTVMDHNSVLRPLSALKARAGVDWSAVEIEPETTRLNVGAFADAIRPNTRLAVVNHASNVTGVLQPIDEIAETCRDRGVLLLVDAAQSAGHVPIAFERWGIDLLACPGHKGLLSPLGTGLLVIRAGLEDRLQTVREGGTGSESERPFQPDTLPDKFEAGSHNAPGLAGLHAALRWIENRTIASLREHELNLITQTIERLDRCAGLTWYGPRNPDHRVGVFSVRLEGFAPAELSATLERDFGLLTRSGLHCAPLAHAAIDTAQTGGTTRLSFGPFVSARDVERAQNALARLTER